MAALIFLACNAIQVSWDFVNAFVRRGLSYEQSVRYIQNKRRLQVFHKHCRAVWQQQTHLELLQRYEYAAEFADRIDAIQVPSSDVIWNYSIPTTTITNTQIAKIKSAISQNIKSKNTHLESIAAATAATAAVKMKRGGIDFAAIEASAEAYEALDSFAAPRYTSLDDFVHAERHHTDALLLDEAENYDDIEVISGLEVDTTFYEYIDSLPVFHDSNIGELKDGISFIITGYIQANCERFSINFILENETRDIALHINPRLPQNYIVRNTKAKNIWGREEVTSALPFSLHRGSKFAIQILITDACYMISVNGHHFAEYNHRLPYKAVSTIEVKGDVDNISMDRAEVVAYPDRLPESRANQIRLAVHPPPALDANGKAVETLDQDEVDGQHIPNEWRIIRMQGSGADAPKDVPSHFGISLPYYGQFPAKSLYAGRCLKIEGRVKLLPHSFYINLQQGQNIWPHPIIAFHFNPRFSKQSGAIGKAIVCRNAWHTGAWAQEERSELDTDFRPGKTFSLAIVCGTSSFEVYVNRKLITEFKYQVMPDIVDTVYIQGDIKLWDVTLENNVTLNGNKRIYQNPAYTDEY